VDSTTEATLRSEKKMKMEDGGTVKAKRRADGAVKGE
jgi:hypothetical protein